jgi:ferredoxin
MEKVRVIKDACIGCGSCSAICPDVFDMGDDGFAFVKPKHEEVREELRVDILDALEGCPTSAIELYEEEKK